MFPTRRGTLLALLPLLSLPGILAFATSPLLRAHPAASGAIHSAQPSVCRRLHTQRLEPLALIAGLDPGAVPHVPTISSARIVLWVYVVFRRNLSECRTASQSRPASIEGG